MYSESDDERAWEVRRLAQICLDHVTEAAGEQG